MIGAVVIIVLSAVIGFLLGLAKRDPGTVESFELDAAGERLTASSLAENKDLPLLLPAPVIPNLDVDGFKYLFYLDEDDSKTDEFEFIPVKISELLKYREIGFESNIKAFQFNNEELDIITGKNELVEP
jgi:hypothetical protein